MILNEKYHFRGWTDADRRALAQPLTLEQLLAIALRVIERLGAGIHMVSGPISTGGTGSIPGNLEIFRNTIELLQANEFLKLFSQMPFEDQMVRINREWRAANNGQYCMPILEEFYWPIFMTGKITKVHFICGWDDSTGAKWEHEKCRGLGIIIRHLPRDLVRRRELVLA